MRNISAIFLLVLITGCASTTPTLVRYDLNNDEKRLIKINPIQNKTGNPIYDSLCARLTGKFIDDIERSGKYKVVGSGKTSENDPDNAPDSEANASVTQIEFNDNCLFGLIAWVNTPTVEVDMDMRVTDIETADLISKSRQTLSYVASWFQKGDHDATNSHRLSSRPWMITVECCCWRYFRSVIVSLNSFELERSSGAYIAEPMAGRALKCPGVSARNL